MSTTSVSLPPGPRGLPFIGNILPFQRRPLEFFRQVQEKYGRIATIHIGKKPILLVFRPEHIRYILTEHPRDFVKPSVANGTGLKHFLGDGLLTIDGEMHRQQRRLVQPAFHKHRVDSYGQIMARFAQETVETWQPGKVVNIASEMQRLTLRIITKTLFNIDSLEQTEQLGHAFDAVINAGNQQATLGRFNAKKRPQKAIEGARILDEFVYGLIAERRKNGQDTGDVLSMLLAAQQGEEGMTDKQVHDHILTFVAAGHETAQNTLSWTFYLLSKHPRVQEKLQAELHEILQGRTPTLDDLAHLPYLEAVINEAWRFYPPAWRQARQAIKDFELDGYHIPAGTIVILSQWVLHNLPDIWGDPEHFRPERWDTDNGNKVPQGAYFPFGLGPRICIGMPFAQLETRLLLATILQRYTPRLAPHAHVALQPLVTLRPRYGMLMQLEPSTQASQSVATSIE